MADSYTVLFLRDTLHGGDPAQAAAVAQSLADFAPPGTRRMGHRITSRTPASPLRQSKPADI